MDAMDFLPMFREKLKLLEMDEKLDEPLAERGLLGRREEA